MPDYCSTARRHDKYQRGWKRWCPSTHKPMTSEECPRGIPANDARRASQFSIRGKQRLRQLQSLLCMSLSEDDSSLDSPPYFGNTISEQTRVFPRTLSSSSSDFHSVHTPYCYDDPNLVPRDSRIPVICRIAPARSLLASSSAFRKFSPSSVFNRRSSRL